MSNPRAAQLVEAGMWLRLSGDHEGARRLFDQALKLDPENARARQLLEAQATAAAPAPPPPAQPPAQERSNPFAPEQISTPMDLDWGSATGFSPTPVPFIPPVEFRPPAPTAPADFPKDDFELPVELDIESVPPPVFGDAAPSTLVFGLGGATEVPAPAPTAPEHWATEPTASSPTMLFQDSGAAGPTEEVPWGAVTFEEEVEEPAPSTMQFARPSDITPMPPGPAAGGGTMQFARPSEPIPSPRPYGAEPESGGTMQFARPSEPIASPHPFGSQPTGEGGTMQFARPGELESTSSGTMQFAQPQQSLSEDNWGDVLADLADGFSIPTVAPLRPPPSEPKFAPNATSAWDQRSNPGIKLTELAPGMGAALDLVTADRPMSSPPAAKSKLDEVRTLVRGAKDLLGLDDHTGAMDLILKAQELAPNDPEVQALRSKSEATLEAMFESKLGKLSSAPRVKLKDDEIIWLNLDHRAGFVLAQIDGQCTFEDLFSVSGMSRLDTARILAQLIEEGVITS
jgi:hypothetical protein